MEQTLYIKGMVCKRCVLAVEAVFYQNTIFPKSIVMGKVQLSQILSPRQTKEVINHLQDIGFEISNDFRVYLVERIKHVILSYIQDSNKGKQKLSERIVLELETDYSSLSNLFSSLEATSIEKYALYHKIERVKVLLREGEFSIKEIAYQTRFSSTSHLSFQFKKLMGMSISEYRKKMSFSSL